MAELQPIKAELVREADPLQGARRRIKELEAELKVVKAASALFEEGAVDPKGSTRLSEV